MCVYMYSYMCVYILCERVSFDGFSVRNIWSCRKARFYSPFLREFSRILFAYSCGVYKEFSALAMRVEVSSRSRCIFLGDEGVLDFLGDLF